VARIVNTLVKPTEKKKKKKKKKEKTMALTVVKMTCTFDFLGVRLPDPRKSRGFDFPTSADRGKSFSVDRSVSGPACGRTFPRATTGPPCPAKISSLPLNSSQFLTPLEEES
jgi:hypothetical protein